MKLAKSSRDDEVGKLSDHLESCLIDISSFMRRVVSNILSFSIIARSLSTLDTMRDIVEKKCTGHGPSSNIASF